MFDERVHAAARFVHGDLVPVLGLDNERFLWVLSTSKFESEMVVLVESFLGPVGVAGLDKVKHGVVTRIIVYFADPRPGMTRVVE